MNVAINKSSAFRHFIASVMTSQLSGFAAYMLTCPPFYLIILFQASSSQKSDVIVLTDMRKVYCALMTPVYPYAPESLGGC
jgi:hypothetical protein